MTSNFYNEKQIVERYDEIVPAYQNAFKEAPWYESSKCVDVQRRCIGGMSALAVGDYCQTCDATTTQPAYQKQELIDQFTAIGEQKKTAWYVEDTESGLAVAALAWRTNAQDLWGRKYNTEPEMKPWMSETLQDDTIVWLDEVFANKQVRASNNLDQFAQMCNGFMDRLDCDKLAYRTISQQMLRAACRTNGAAVYADNPDRRYFVVMDRTGDAK